MKGLTIFTLLVIVVLLGTTVTALKGSIGNARIYIDEVIKKGEFKVVERTIKVNNRNNVTVLVNVNAFGNITDLTEIIDKEFTLEPGESKNARFKVKLDREIHVEGRIGVGFSAINDYQGGAGVGLQSVVIVHTTIDNSTAAVDHQLSPPEPGKPVSPSKNPLIGFVIILLILIIGVIAYLLITKRV